MYERLCLAQLQGKTVQNVIDYTDRTLITFTDKTFICIEAYTNEYSEPYLSDSKTFDIFYFDKTKLLAIGLLTEEEWEEENKKRGAEIREQKLRQYNYLKKDLGL